MARRSTSETMSAMANTKVAELGHKALGLSDADVLAMYRQMLLARAVDERMWLMQRAGKIAFIISGQGHEAAQIGLTWPMRPNQDWMAPYYRSIASALTFGMTPEDIRPRVITKLRRQLSAAVRAGTMRPIKPEQFMVNLMSLCIFPFAARPMLEALLGLNDRGFEQFIDRRRKELAPFFLRALRP